MLYLDPGREEQANKNQATFYNYSYVISMYKDSLTLIVNKLHRNKILFLSLTAIVKLLTCIKDVFFAKMHPKWRSNNFSAHISFPPWNIWKCIPVVKFTKLAHPRRRRNKCRQRFFLTAPERNITGVLCIVWGKSEARANKLSNFYDLVADSAAVCHRLSACQVIICVLLWCVKSHKREK